MACNIMRKQGFRTICVLETPCVEECSHRRILRRDTFMLPDDDNKWDESGVITAEEYRRNVRVDNAMLDRALLTIDAFLEKGPVLVHCAAGIERSPLTVAVWLQRRHGMTLDEAYEHVMKRRPIVQDRRAWLQTYTEKDLIGGC